MLKRKFNSLLTAAAMLLGLLAQNAAASISGAIYTSLGDGSIVNQNLYSAKPLVHLNGGPQNLSSGGLAPLGTYYYQVTDPNGATVLSSDPAVCRQLVVALGSAGKGVILGVPATPAPAICNGPGANRWHNVGSPNVNNGGALPVQLVPFDDTPNSGGEYKVWLIAMSCATPATPDSRELIFSGSCDTKTDNFKVGNGTPPPDGSLTVLKECYIGTTKVAFQGPEFLFSGGVDMKLRCGDSATVAVDPLPGSYDITESQAAGTFGWELRDITCRNNATNAVLGTVSGSTVSVTVDSTNPNVTCTFKNYQARMPLHKLINGEKASCTTNGVPNLLNDDTGVRPCTFVNAGLTLPDNSDPRFTVNLYPTVNGLPFTGAEVFPAGYAAQALIPPVFEAPGFIGVPLTLCEAPDAATAYTMFGVTINVTGPDGQTVQTPAVYNYFGYRCFNILIPSRTTLFEININNRRAARTVTQGGWGATPKGGNPGTILDKHSCGTGNIMPFAIGHVPATDFYLQFQCTATTKGQSVRNYLKFATGTPGVLNASRTYIGTNADAKTDTAAGIYGAQVLALQLNTTLGGLNVFAPFVGIGGFILHDVDMDNDGNLDSVNGMSVSAVLAKANDVLGGNLAALPTDANSTYSVAMLNNLVDLINNAFENGAPSAWAVAHL